MFATGTYIRMFLPYCLLLSGLFLMTNTIKRVHIKIYIHTEVDTNIHTDICIYTMHTNGMFC